MANGNGSVLREVWKWVAVAIAAGFIGTAQYVLTADVYNKIEVDQKVEALRTQHERDLDRVYEELGDMDENIKWLVRHEGGDPAGGGD